ncbi:MAG TPA: CUB protein, partial [Bacteroidia bacterium]|nr:CUB protein [Bacteroidia bacterium]
MKKRSKILLFVFSVIGQLLFSQNENKKWYFGNQAGLDFTTTPPTILTNSAMNALEGCASMADGSGNLLFYTDGVTVYNSSHTAMSNGTGLFGNNSACQACIILRQPGSTSLYYIFTVQGVSGSAGLNYSIVDMTLSSGQGSVTVKNSPLYSAGCYEKLTGTQHCNGSDFWVLSHDIGSSVFRAHQLTSVGVSPSVVTSTIGTAVGLPYSLGCMKISPNGTKLGMTDYLGYVDLFDFNNSTGAVTNSLSLLTNFSSYGCEFSPDGTKFYAGGFGNGSIRQWDLCAGTNTAI